MIDVETLTMSELEVLEDKIKKERYKRKKEKARDLLSELMVNIREVAEELPLACISYPEVFKLSDVIELYDEGSGVSVR